MATNEKIAGAVVTLSDGQQQHHSNVVSCGIRRSRSSIAAVLTLIDGTQRVIEGAIEVKGVDRHFLERCTTTHFFGRIGQF